MSSQHADPALTVRVPAEIKRRAHGELMARDLELRGFVEACLSAFAEDPDRFLTELSPHWPARKPRGRPAKA
ncbi:hypothetical protein FOS14_03490 [Skermania sp. ID1734]|nr:hypothetical protein FOS14_03490 [Skermania sp. ID1734]